MRKIPVLKLNFPRHSSRDIFRLSTGIFRKYASQTWYICIQYCRKVVGDLEVTVAVTPNGYADAVTDGKFVMPYEKTMHMKDFLNIIESPKDYKGIFYIQKQNSNLTDEFSTLLQDVDSGISWGTDAFGKLPRYMIWKKNECW